MDLPGVASMLQERLDEIAEALVPRIRAEVDSYADEVVVPRGSLRLSLERNAQVVLAYFAEGREPDTGPARETGRIRAEQGVPLGDALHAYRIAFDALWAQVLDEARRHPEVGEAELAAGSSEIWMLFGRYAEVLAAAYRETSTELSRQREARRSALVEAVCRGDITDRDGLDDAARHLGLPKDGPYVVVAAAPGERGEPSPGIEAALSEVHVPSAWTLLPDQRIGVLSLAVPDAETVILRTLRRRRTRIGVSPPFDSLGDTPLALRFARLALVGLTRESAGVARFDDHPLAMVVAGAPEEATRLVKVVLEPVLALPAHDRTRLLETLRHWFAEGGRAQETAERMFLHPNTVRYRLRRIEELTGRSLSDPRTLADLGAALEALRILPR
ncbi:PucR-like helix-turn-helix protein [Streptomyces sp. TLI_235]|nr:helix-turn-helix domain-containing protein [Streptomyces sp. TLI_235]PBC77059.1 PucR-like helix-turn-helix protein [Streptomyces sp. TLI_235]